MLTLNEGVMQITALWLSTCFAHKSVFYSTIAYKLAQSVSHYGAYVHYSVCHPH